MGAMASQITSLTNVCSSVYSGADQGKHLCSVSLAIVQGIHRWPVNSPHKVPVARKMFPFDDVIMHVTIQHVCQFVLGSYHWFSRQNNIYFYETWTVRSQILCDMDSSLWGLGQISEVHWKHDDVIIFRVTGHLCGEFTGHRWIPRTKATDTELSCFLWSVPE